MRISDWSSDVCSSDLHDVHHRAPRPRGAADPQALRPPFRRAADLFAMADPGAAPHPAAAAPCRPGHASGGCDIARNDGYSLDRGTAGGGRGLFGAVLFLGAV